MPDDRAVNLKKRDEPVARGINTVSVHLPPTVAINLQSILESRQTRKRKREREREHVAFLQNEIERINGADFDFIDA